MANYSNNVRYNRVGNPYSSQRQNYSTQMMTRESCNCGQSTRPEERSCNCSNTQSSERQSEKSTCNCSRENQNESFEQDCTDKLSEMPLAMAYVPWQKWHNIYEICKGFQRGTIFCELDKPFLGRGGCNR